MNLSFAVTRLFGFAPLILLFLAPAAHAVAPTVTIDAPSTGSSFAIGSNVAFTGSATDAEDDDVALTAAIAWTSNIDGGIGTGGSFSTSSLSVGTHTITASVTDSEALSDSDSISITITNDTPSVSITLPSDGSSFAVGANVTFQGSATDTEDGTLTGSLSWTSSIDSGIGSGGSFSTSSLSAGTHTITASVTDSNGNPGSDSITVTITNNAPTVTITSPTDGASVALGTNISFRADGSDVEDNNGQITNSISWTSSLDGSIGSGGNFNSGALTAGTHTITASVTDSDGNPGADSVTITVTNSTPIVNITQPSNGSSFAFGTNITFVGTATDAEDGNLASSIGWSSNVDGVLGSGGSISVNDLSVGPHTITASVTDSNGNPGLDSIAITITNNAPTVAITSPSNGASFAAGTNVGFVATATDTEDGNLAPSVAWTSSIDGALGTGGSISVSDLSIGNHTITASVTDSDGGSDSDSIAITIANNAPTVTITSPANDASFTAGTNITFVATATDTEDGNLAPSVAWTSSIDGALGTGGSISVSDLSIGNHTITASATDSDDGSGSDSISISITNTAPVADAQDVSTDEDVALPIVLTGSDAEDDPLTYTFNQPSNGEVTGTGPNVTYTPNPNFNGADSFTFTVNDGQLTSTAATVTITVNPVNDAPVATDDNPPAIDEGGSIVGAFNVLSNDSDVDGDTLIAIVVTEPVNAASFLLNPDGTFAYIHDGSETTTDSFTYQVDDGGAEDNLSNVATVSITINSVNDDPVVERPIAADCVADPALCKAIEDSPFVLDVSDNFSDADGDTLTFSAQGLPASGRLTIDPDTGIISGTPRLEDARDNEPYIVIVQASDGVAGSVAAEDQFELSVSARDRADLALAISLASPTALPGEQVDWTFSGLNVGPADGVDVVLSGSFLGTGVTVSPPGASGCTITNLTDQVDFSCPVGTVPNGSVTDLVFLVSATQPTELVGFATLAGAQPDPIDPVIRDNSAFAGIGVADSLSAGAVQLLDDTASNSPVTVLSLASGSMNSLTDTVNDLVVGTVSGEPVRVFLNDVPREPCQCQRDFQVGISVPDLAANRGVALADFDGDTILDIAVANGNMQPTRVWKNDGAGGFTLMAELEAANANGVATGDFDNDGNMDFAVAASSPNLVYFGDGNGGFSAPVLLQQDAVEGESSFDVAVGNFDGVGGDDIVFANVGADSQVWVATSGRGFELRDTLAIGDAVSVEAANLDGIGPDDLVFGRVSGGPGDIPANPVLLNPGNGDFDVPVALLGRSATNDVLVGDIDGVAPLDIVVISATGVHQVWMASGGSYVLHTEQIFDPGVVAGVVSELGDTDTATPGGADMAIGGAPGAGLGIYLNDAAGNLGRGDPVPPEMTLLGEATVVIDSGTPYDDAGATATDNIDGDITSNIVVTGSVNTAVVGTYTLTYNVADFAGNAAIPVERIVNVNPAAGQGGGGGGGSLSIGLLCALLGLLLLVQARCAPEREREQAIRTRKGLRND